MSGLTEELAILVPVHKEILWRGVHSPGDLFPSPLQVVDGIALKSREDGIEGGEVFQDSTLLERRTM
jgi:hypothetical protein